MTVYEMRTYTLHVGKMGEAVKLYSELGYPALQKGGQDKKLIGYFQADTGTINQLVHLWKFNDDADRRAHWASVFREQGLRRGLRREVSPADRDARGQALDRGPVGTASLSVNGRSQASPDRAPVSRGRPD
jgi:NIPSNAP